MLHHQQASPTLSEFIDLVVGQGHQVAIYHTGQLGLIFIDGKTKTKAIFELLNIETIQQIGALRVLQLIELAQHGIRLALFDRRYPLLESVSTLPLLITEQSKQGGIVEGFRHQNTLALELRDVVGDHLAFADQDKPVDGNHPAKDEFIRQCRGFRQTGHHVSLPTAQLLDCLRHAGGRYQLVFQAGLLGDPAQHIRTPSFRLPQIIDAAIGHQLGIDHQTNGAPTAR